MKFLVLIATVFVLGRSNGDASSTNHSANQMGTPWTEGSEPEVKASRPAIGHMRTTMSVSCSLMNAPGENVEETWTRGSDGKVITDSEAEFNITSSTEETTITSTLTIGATVNTQDDTYTCTFKSEDSSEWNGTAKVYLFIVTPHNATVKKGELATLSCVMTDIVKNLTVTWKDGQGKNITELPGHSFVNGINVDGVQESTMTIKKAEKNATYTCTLHPYPDETYTTPVQLFVTSSAHFVGSSAILAGLFFVLSLW